MKIKITLLLLAFATISCGDQKKEKIKGNKEVVDVYRNLDDFSEIIISDNLEVSIKQDKTNLYHLETDENLVDAIAFEIADDVLKIYTKNRILSSKRLNITLSVSNLEKITLEDSAEIETMNKIESKELLLIALDDSKFKIDLMVDDATITMNDNSNGDVQLKGGDAKLVLNDNTYFKGKITLNTMELEINKRADFKAKGTVEDLKITATGSTDINAEELQSEKANLIANNNADVYVFASKELKLYANGKSNIYVYGNPDIQVDGLNDKSQIIKK